MPSKLKTLLAVTGTAMLAPTLASALTLTFDDTTSVSSNTPHTGASGTVELSFTSFSPGSFQVDITVENTTGNVAFGAGATASQLTGFGMDMLGTSTLTIVGADLSSALDTVLFDADFNPYGDLDVAWADNSNFLGGNANDALSEGDTATGMVLGFTDATFLTAADAEAAYAAAFFGGTLQAGLRFQQVSGDQGYNGADSDKLNYTGTTPVSTVPLPAGGLLLLTALGGLALRRRS